MSQIETEVRAKHAGNGDFQKGGKGRKGGHGMGHGMGKGEGWKE